MNIGKASASFNRLFIRKRQRPEASPLKASFQMKGSTPPHRYPA